MVSIFLMTIAIILGGLIIGLSLFIFIDLFYFEAIKAMVRSELERLDGVAFSIDENIVITGDGATFRMRPIRSSDFREALGIITGGFKS